MRPRLVTEHLTGLRWVATCRWSRWLAWVPSLAVVAAGVAGFVLGRLSWAGCW